MTSTQETSGQLKDEGRHLTDEVKEKGAELGQEAKHEARRVMDDVRDRARTQGDEQAGRAAGALRGVADQLGSMADSTDQQGMLVDFARDGADRIQRLADHVEQDGVQGIIDDIEMFARRRPGMFIAAGLGLGFVLGRMVKAGAEVMQDNGQSNSPGSGMYDIRDEPSRTTPTTTAPPLTPTSEPAGTPVSSGRLGDERIRP